MIVFAIVYVLVVYISIGVGFFDGVYLTAKNIGLPDEPSAAAILVAILIWPYGIYLFSKKKGEKR